MVFLFTAQIINFVTCKDTIIAYSILILLKVNGSNYDYYYDCLFPKKYWLK